ncbi:uncharacterized protein EV420DRAFT_1508783 [Desarmillaria tabescens]|uniref:Uncharacterized protein n=1 Tax=Armillaria tabescens TaxID=1929756 RepID=A0AA39NHV6_ARMTA|nr:uncharacterized protein EV420DRAFT_1508783 [Desarmillaria tabescens]KAK0465917.1 hypothetical protein EV420DRAFT_1508783 [Desarmillaria tabescens]
MSYRKVSDVHLLVRLPLHAFRFWLPFIFGGKFNSLVLPPSLPRALNPVSFDMTNTSDGLNILYDIIRLTCQTLVYGMYIIIMLVCSFVMLKRGLRGKSRILLFCILVFMFSFSTAYWIVSICQAVYVITISFVHGIPLDSIAYAYGEKQDIMNALVLLNYVLTDGIVVWRAWVICRDWYSKILILPLVFLCLTLLSVFVTIGLRITISTMSVSRHTVMDHTPLTHALNCSQIINLALSLLTNIFSTSIVGVKAWRHKHCLMSELQVKRRKITVAERIFTLLVESGIIYCLSGIMALIATEIQLPFGNLSDVYTPVQVQFAGIYPTLVILLVSRQGELNETTMFTVEDKRNPSEQPSSVLILDTIEFGDNPPLSSSFGEAETLADVRRNESMVSRLSRA